MTREFDIVIVGGGMVGAALACALGATRWRIAVIESAPPAPIDASDPFDLRVSAINLAARNLLDNVGAWQKLWASHRLCPYRRMRVWEDAGGETCFDSSDAGEPVLGYFVENRLLQLVLLEQLDKFSNVALVAPAKLEDIIIDTDAVTLQTDAGTLSTKLLVAADGARSRVREAAGIGVHAWDYEQSALVATVATVLPQQDTTWQRFTPTGPQAFLPLPGQRASLVWYHRRREVRRLQSLPDDTFIAELEATFPACLGGITGLVGKAGFPLRRMHAQRYVEPRIALIGDAAHTVHPLAGQGVNLGFRDAAALAEVLSNVADTGLDPGDIELLRGYERSRRHDNLTMLTITDMFYRLFSNDDPVVKLGRNIALDLAGRFGPAKRQAIRIALGLAGRQSLLTRASTEGVRV